MAAGISSRIMVIAVPYYFTTDAQNYAVCGSQAIGIGPAAGAPFPGYQTWLNFFAFIFCYSVCVTGNCLLLLC